jgi:ketosteroid isomerase-like protein
MFKKFAEGLVFGAGFAISVAIVWTLATSVLLPFASTSRVSPASRVTAVEGILKSIATVLVACAVVALTACASVPGDVAGDRAALLALHEEAMEAHRKSDVDLLLRAEADDFVLVNRGEISHPGLEQRRQVLGSYLRGVRFSEYVDTAAPAVHVSADGGTGWLIAQVRARGTEVAGAGRALQFESAWIELYEKRDGRWRRVGNVSNFK